MLRRSLLRLVALVTVMTTLIAVACTADPDLATETLEILADGASDGMETTISTSGQPQVMVLWNECAIPDPAIDSSYAQSGLGELSLVAEIHAGLTRIDEEDGDVVVPELAESWVVRDDGRTYEFTLRDGLRFSDGSPLTAADVKWSWERALQFAESWTNAVDAFGAVLGADRVLAGESGELRGLEVVDDLTLTVRLEVPVPLFPMMISGPVASVLKRDNVESWPVRWTNEYLVTPASRPYDYDFHEFGFSEFTDKTMVVGAGPFKLVEFRVDDPFADCVFSRNEHYWGQRAALDAVVFTQQPLGALPSSPSQVVGWFRDDLIDVFPAAATSEVEALQQNEGARVETYAPAPYTFFLAFNPAVPPLDDVHFRRGMVYSVDPEQTYECPTCTLATSIVPPSLSSRSSGIGRLGADVEAAQAELGKSRYSGNTQQHELVIVSDGADSFRTQLERLFALWSDGLDLRAEIRYIETFDQYQATRDGAQFPVRIFAIQPTYPDPNAVLRVFDGAFGSGGGQSSNHAPTVDLLNRAVSEADPKLRSDLYAELERNIIEEALALPMFMNRPENQVLVQSWVRGFAPNRFGGSVFRDVWFEGDAPERAMP